MGVYDEFSRLVDKILDVREDRIGRALKLWLELKDLLMKIRPACSELQMEGVLEELLTSGCRFEMSAAGCAGPLREEWESIARVDLKRLRENLLALRRIAEKRKEKFETILLEKFLEDELKIPPAAIVDELAERGYVSKSTAAYLRSRKAELGKHSEELKRIVGLLVQLRRLEDELA